VQHALEAIRLKQDAVMIYLDKHIATGSMRLLHKLFACRQQLYRSIIREVLPPTKKCDRF
jgi:hypothetical protein